MFDLTSIREKLRSFMVLMAPGMREKWKILRPEFEGRFFSLEQLQELASQGKLGFADELYDRENSLTLKASHVPGLFAAPVARIYEEPAVRRVVFSRPVKYGMAISACLLVIWWMANRNSNSVEPTSIKAPSDHQANLAAAEKKAEAPKEDAGRARGQEHSNAVASVVLDEALGELQDEYHPFGYQDIILGSDYSVVAAKHNLKWTMRDNPAAYTNAQAENKEQFFFSKPGGKLVCYTRSYDGGVNDYADKLKGIFGPSRQAVESSTSEGHLSASVRSSVHYHFERVLGRVTFVKQTKYLGPPSSHAPITSEFTHVSVIDKAWVEQVLRHDIETRQTQLDWVSRLVEIVAKGNYGPNDLPAMTGADVEARDDKPSFEKYSYRDLGSVRQNEKNSKGVQVPVYFAGIEDRVDPLSNRKIVRVIFNFSRYSVNKRELIERQFIQQEGLVDPFSRHHPLIVTPFYHVLYKVNVALAQLTFPPKSDKITVTRNNVGKRYEWYTLNGRKIVYSEDDVLVVEIMPEKKL